MPDSSPVALSADLPRRPLKRSASTASLPTPPRTQHRRKKGGRRSRSTNNSSEEDSEGEAGSTDEEKDRSRRNSKRRRISDVQEVNEEDEDAFWAGGQVGKGSKSAETQHATADNTRSETLSAEDGEDEQVPLLFRRKLNQSTTGIAPVSPPPSHRRPRAAKVAVAVIPPTIEEDNQDSPTGTVASTPPRTPRSRISKSTLIKDSPNNPFISSPVDENESDQMQSPFTTPNQGERETMTFVFRGVKKTFPNPYYDAEKKRAKSPNPNSLLPPEHPDYSPDMRAAPKVLWPSRKKGGLPMTEPPSPSAAASKRKKAGKRATKALLDSDDEREERSLDDSPLPMKPVRLFDAPKLTS